MGNDVSKVVVQSGLVADMTLQELGRWGAPVPSKDDGPEMPAEIIPSVIERAMQEESFVQIRETDLEVLGQYLRTRQQGVLHVELIDGSVDEFEIDFGFTPLHELVIAWTEGDIVESIATGLTYVMAAGNKYVLKNVRELFYGTQQAFLVCQTV